MITLTISWLRVQPRSHCGRPMWHYKSLNIFSKMSVSCKILCRKVGKLQNTMKPFFLNFPLINNVFLLVPPAVPVIIEDTSNFQDFLSFLKFIYTPIKRVSKVTVLDVGKSQNTMLECGYYLKSHNTLKPFFSIPLGLTMCFFLSHQQSW